MSFFRVIRAPLALGILSVLFVLVLDDHPTGQFIGVCAGVAGMIGFSINSASATYQRARVAGRATSPFRSGVATVSALTWCVIGFMLVVMGAGYISYVMRSEYYHVMKDPPGLLGGVVLVAAALSGLCSGAAGLFYLARPTIRFYRASILAAVSAVVATISWSIVSYPPFANSASHSHSAGAGFGTFLVVFAIPLMVIVLLVLHLLLIRSLRKLIDLP